MKNQTNPRRELRNAIIRQFTFHVRKGPLPGDLRPTWRITVLCLMLLRAGRAGSMSLKKALLLNWGVRTQRTRGTLLRMIDGQRSLQDVPVRFDPALNRALDYAAAEKLVRAISKSTGSIVMLLPAGEKLATQVFESKECLEVEKAFFNSVRHRLPEEKVKELLNWETTLWA